MCSHHARVNVDHLRRIAELGIDECAQTVKGPMAGYDEQALKARALEYTHKAKVLRQIQSAKLQRSTHWDNVLNYSTVIASATVAGLGFFGVKNLHSLFFSSYISLEKLDFVFNSFVLLLLIATFLQMTLNLKEKSLGHLRSIRELTDFITTLDDLQMLKDVPPDVCDRHVERLNDRYKTINSVLPANSDSEWWKAKAVLERKER